MCNVIAAMVPAAQIGSGPTSEECISHAKLHCVLRIKRSSLLIDSAVLRLLLCQLLSRFAWVEKSCSSRRIQSNESEVSIHALRRRPVCDPGTRSHAKAGLAQSWAKIDHIRSHIGFQGNGPMSSETVWGADPCGCPPWRWGLTMAI